MKNFRKNLIVVALMSLVLACTWIGLVNRADNFTYSTASNVTKVVKECVIALKEE